MVKVFDLLTIFPKFFDSYLSQSLVHKAIQKKLVECHVHDLRKWATDKHHTVDDIPYGGGAGMVFKPEPLFDAIQEIHSSHKNGKVIYLSCQGNLLNQKKVKELFSNSEEILLVCGRYEGIDQRVIDEVIDEEISIGDYVLSGGEVPALAVMDSLIRLIPGVIGKAVSLEEESFEAGLLEYPHYTRPEVFRERVVPEVLLSGNHSAIRSWRLERAVEKTLNKRPDLLKKHEYSEEIQKMMHLFDNKKRS